MWGEFEKVYAVTDYVDADARADAVQVEVHARDTPAGVGYRPAGMNASYASQPSTPA